MLRSRCALQFHVTNFLRSSVEDTYRKMNQREHIIKRPEMYVGSTHKVDDQWWFYNPEKKAMTFENIEFIPAFYKIFDEILVNAADNKVRDQAKQTFIKVSVDPKSGWIHVENDGSGIPVKMHKEYNLWVPQLIFGNLLTSSNYNDDVKRTTGGCYGYGAKLTNIFSQSFAIDTYDPVTNRRFQMKWNQNMQNSEGPMVTENYCKDGKSRAGYTKISFLPDYKMLDMPDGMTKDMQRMLERRVMDLAGILGESTRIYLNDELVNVRSFKQYAELFPINPESIVHRKYPRWEVTVGMSADEKFHGISFVNSTFTSKNGTHLKHVLDGIVHEVRSAVARTDPSIRIRLDYVKQNLFIFINCQIENPKFDSQQKYALTSQHTLFGSLPDIKEIGEAVVKETGIVEKLIQEHQRRTMKKLTITTNSRQMLCIPKLEDAAMAGEEHGDKCTLIITEGDSAKALAMSGLNVIGRDFYGVFPIRGKLLNARGLSTAQILRCDEIRNIMTILGIDLASKDPKPLRYGRVMIMADQDIDGFHIKGLLCNLFQVAVPDLFKKKGFLVQFITPLVKVTGPRGFSKSFYSTKAYTEYTASLPEEKAKQLRTKYYKGLGTSTAAEAREYFANIERNTIEFVYDEKTDETALEVPFGKVNADTRREWILKGAQNAECDAAEHQQITYHDFVQKFLMQFSLQDCARSIPNVIDGLKTTQRKILYGALQRDLRTSIKVQQLAGYVSEHCAYHQNEASLNATIIRMAQDYVGSNNLPLFDPEGQFGTRMENGNDAAASRYIFTRLQSLTKLIFRPEDEANLTYTNTDGQRTEPDFYVPIVPMVLINGAQGIATGFRTSIPPHGALDVIQHIRDRLDGKQPKKLEPHFEGFLGDNFRTNFGYQTIGRWRLMNETCIRIEEIPISESIQDMKAHFSQLYQKGIVSSFSEHHTSNYVEFDIYCHPQVIALLIRANAVHSTFRLVGSKSQSLLVCLDEGRIAQYAHTEEIFDHFFKTRLHFYDLRKRSTLVQLERQRLVLENRRRFLSDVLSGKLEVPRDANAAVNVLTQRNYAVHPKEKTFAYLLDQRMSSLNTATLAHMESRIASLKTTMKELRDISVKDIWRRDLEELENAVKKRAEEVPSRVERPADVKTSIELKADALQELRALIRMSRRRPVEKKVE